MFDLVELIFEFQLLRSKSETLGLALDEEERPRLIGLARLLDSGAAVDSADRMWSRVRAKGPVQFTALAGFGLGQIFDVSGGGLCVSTSRPLSPGARTVVRLVDPMGGREFVFPCRVVWNRGGSQACMGLRFDGVPLRLSFGIPTVGEWRGFHLGADSPTAPILA